MRKISVVVIGLVLVLGMALIGACSSNDADEERSVEVMSHGEEFNPSYESEIVMPADLPTQITGAGGDFGSDTDRMIVRTGNLNLKVKDVGEALDRIKGIADLLDGYVISSSRYGGEKEGTTANISIRVPADKYDDAVKSLRGLAVEVLEETSNAKDVTEEYSDLGAELRNLEATESRYLELLDKATTV